MAFPAIALIQYHASIPVNTNESSSITTTTTTARPQHSIIVHLSDIGLGRTVVYSTNMRNPFTVTIRLYNVVVRNSRIVINFIGDIDSGTYFYIKIDESGVYLYYRSGTYYRSQTITDLARDNVLTIRYDSGRITIDNSISVTSSPITSHIDFVSVSHIVTNYSGVIVGGTITIEW